MGQIIIDGRNGNYPTTEGLPELSAIPDTAPPYPDMIMRCLGEAVNEGYPCVKGLIGVPVKNTDGAFKNAANLETIKLPASVKKIGEYAFTNTALKNVTIAADCTYYPTSFPEGCEISFYGGGGDYVPLADSEGFIVLDADGARIYVRSV